MVSGMPKLLTVLLVVLFMATPLVALLSFHEDCSEQACHMLMTNLFILTSTTMILAMFLISPLINNSSSLGIIYHEEIFLPPRF